MGRDPGGTGPQFKLTLGQVHAALAYYYLHKSALDDEMRRDQDLADRLQAELAEQGKLGRLD